jgi:hypothetical protein
MSVSSTRHKNTKRFVQAVKTLRGLQRIPAPLPRPGSESFKFSPNEDASAKEKRQKAYEQASRGRPDKETISFFCSPYSLETRG